jgi:hypothetical protein
MRLTDAEGRLEFEFKDALDAPMPGFQPWFEFESQQPNSSTDFWTLGGVAGQNH